MKVHQRASLSTFRLRATTLAFLLGFLIVGCGERDKLSAPHIEAQLISDQDTITPGATFTLGVRFTLEPGWHIYWKNPGDSGLPPRFTWKPSAGITISDPLWPYPERITTGPLVNYGYGDTTIPFHARLSKDEHGRKAAISLQLEWLVCKDECLPGEGEITISLPISNTPAHPSKHAKEFERAFSQIPLPLERVSIAVEEQQDTIVLALIPLGDRPLPSKFTFFPEDRRVIDNSAEQIASRDGNVARLKLSRDPSNTESISRIRGILVSSEGWSSNGTPKAVSIDTNPGAPRAQDSPLRAERSTEGETSNLSGLGFFMAVAFALLGGLLLNVMPCVFPVLSIKILSFIEHTGNDPHETRKHGLAFAIGVVVSFWLVAFSLLVLQAGGEQLGWGFQLQSPTFVVVMMTIFLGLGLSLLSEVNIGQRLQNIAGSARISTTLAGSMLSGALATAVATPCTAPFMGSALAATLAMPAILSFVVFTALGVGMSAPYVILAYRPGLLRFLPKPGEWMVTFKQLMSFPLFASVVWLTRVFTRQMGLEPPALDLVMNALWGLLGVALSFWIFARSCLSENHRVKRLLALFAFLLCCISLYRAIPNGSTIEESRTRACAPSGVVVPFTDQYGLLWESYSEDRLAKLLAQNRPVYLDFTAEWCITCQVNERVVFSSEEVRNLISLKNVTLMKADWTSKNPAITTALRRFGRNGVPLNVIVSSPSADPVILPNILTPGIVRRELERLP